MESQGVAYHASYVDHTSAAPTTTQPLPEEAAIPEHDAVKMFVGQIPKLMEDLDIRSWLESYGSIYQLNVLRDRETGQSKGCCFVTYYTRKEALDAQNLLHNVFTLPGMQHPVQMKPADGENKRSEERKLFVGMISKTSDEPQIRHTFAPFGQIEECTILREQNGMSKGCAFVTFTSRQYAQNAITALHHSQTMEGCRSPIVVKFADTPKDKEMKKLQQLNASIMSSTYTNTAGGAAANSSALMQLQQVLAVAATALGSSAGGDATTALESIQTLAARASDELAQQQQLAFSAPAPLSASSSSHSLVSYNNQQQPANDMLMMRDINDMPAPPPRAAPASRDDDGTYCADPSKRVGLLSPVELSALLASTVQVSAGDDVSLSSLSSQENSPRLPVPVPPPAAAGKQTEGPSGANLFIYHLPAEYGDYDLLALFAPFGTVISSKVFIDKQTNKSKCFGFVSYDAAEAAASAIQAMSGFEIGSKRLKVQLKRPKSERPF